MIEPHLGLAFPYAKDGPRASVRKDIPARARRWIVKHELYHLRDKKKRWREFRAYSITAFRDPIGFLLFCVHVLRLRLRVQ